MFKANGLIVVVIIALHGCSGSALKEEGAGDVTSEPSGATVYANGKKLGITPLHYNLYKAFPAGWKNMMFQAQGVLMVKMDGCEDFTLEVNDYVISRPIHVELKCDETGKPGLSETTGQQVDNQTPTPVAIPQDEIEKRLQQLDSLYQKRLITDEEYEATRARILNEL